MDPTTRGNHDLTDTDTPHTPSPSAATPYELTQARSVRIVDSIMAAFTTLITILLISYLLSRI